MKDTIWVFQSFGFKIGMQFIFDTIVLKVRRACNGQSVPSCIEDMTDEEIEELADGLDPKAKIVHSYDDTVN